MEIGLEMAGFRTAVCVEIDKDCRKTVGLNRDWPFVLSGDREKLASEQWGKEYLLERKPRLIGLAAPGDGRPEGTTILLDDGCTVELDESNRLRKRGDRYIVEVKEEDLGRVRSKDKKILRHPCGRMEDLDNSCRIRPLPVGDITRLSTADILKAGGLCPGEAALVTGGAPCQPFSTIGEGGGVSTTKGNLFREFMRVVREASPKGFIFENVSGMNQQQHRQVIECIEETAGDIGYSVRVGILNAADYGVPQRRKRLIILGVRKDCCDEAAFPYPTHANDPDALAEKYDDSAPRLQPWVTVRECFKSIHPSEFDRPDSKRMNVSKQMAKRITYIKAGTQDNFRKIPNSLRPECWKDKVDADGRQLGYQGEDPFGRLNADRPSVTMRTRSFHPMTGRFLHPTESRALDTIEMARLQGFPMEWIFHGSLESLGRQIGNAVPPPFAKALGEAFRQLV